MTRSAFRSAAVAITPVVVLCALSVLVASASSRNPCGLSTRNSQSLISSPKGKSESGYRPSDRQLAQWAFEAWERNAAGRFHFEAAPESSALVRLYWAEPDGSEYGEMQPLVVGGRRGAAVYIRPDVQSLGPEIAPRAQKDDLLRDSIVYLTCLHELGHALGLPHTQDFRDIMYFFGYGGDIADYFNRYRKQLRSRSDIASVSGLSDAT